jgi:hypothetical protein
LLFSKAFRWESLLRWDLGFHSASGYHEAFSQILPLSMMGFWLLQSLFTRNFSFFTTNFFLFSRWNSGYQEAFHMKFSFSTMESRPSRSLFTIFLLSQWNSGYHGAFSRIFLLSQWNLGYHGAFSRIFLSQWNSTKCTIWGKTLFIYITKSIYIGSASLKTLPLDLEPPLQGKEYGPPYSNVITKKKANVFPPKSLIDS